MNPGNFFCPACKRTTGSDYYLKMWCTCNGVFHGEDQALFRRDEKTGKLIREWIPMLEFDPERTLFYFVLPKPETSGRLES